MMDFMSNNCHFIAHRNNDDKCFSLKYFHSLHIHPLNSNNNVDDNQCQRENFTSKTTITGALL